MFFSRLGGVNSQPSTGISSTPDTFFGNRLVKFTFSVGWDTLNNPGATCGLLRGTVELRFVNQAVPVVV